MLIMVLLTHFVTAKPDYVEDMGTYKENAKDLYVSWKSMTYGHCPVVYRVRRKVKVS